MRYLFLIIFLFIALVADAQLSAPGSNALRHTSFKANPEIKDPVFIFCDASGTQEGTLTATIPSASPSSDFSWFQWSDTDKGFTIPLKTDMAVTSSTVNNLSGGGYRVLISGAVDTSYTGWIFIDRPYANAELRNRTCDYVAMEKGAALDTFYYKNPVSGLSVALPNRIKFLWSSTPSSTIPFPDLELAPVIYNPPLVDVTYKIEVTDSFGCRNESSFFYESIHVKADFSVDPVKGEAPLEVSFTDKSVRGSVYKWEFGDSKDSVSYLKDPLPHIYYKPGEYDVKLTIESNLHCVDSMRFRKIEVEKSKLEIPNVFTPNDDGMNDRFMVQKKSLKYISVEVFSRSGKMVYNFSGDGEALRNWEGWDGKVNNSSADATPGIYFYIIRAIGWDDIAYDSKEQRGFVYLYR